jgi:hypothetical protein
VDERVTKKTEGAMGITAAKRKVLIVGLYPPWVFKCRSFMLILVRSRIVWLRCKMSTIRKICKELRCRVPALSKFRRAVSPGGQNRPLSHNILDDIVACITANSWYLRLSTLS